MPWESWASTRSWQPVDSGPSIGLEGTSHWFPFLTLGLLGPKFPRQTCEVSVGTKSSSDQAGVLRTRLQAHTGTHIHTYSPSIPTRLPGCPVCLCGKTNGLTERVQSLTSPRKPQFPPLSKSMSVFTRRAGVQVLCLPWVTLKGRKGPSGLTNVLRCLGCGSFTASAH